MYKKQGLELSLTSTYHNISYKGIIMCNRLFYIFLISFLSCNTIYGQKVGLVLSGGGAKGAAHIGLIQALEDNEIPIDYISGTSIGAIVGSMYAMGYSPKEMIDLFMSPDFYNWQTGKIEDSYYYYFRKPAETPEITRFMIPLKNTSDLLLLDAVIPSNIVNPIQMNQSFMNLFAQATVACGKDFNRLLVPFLCVASDVYNKRPVIFQSGDLGDAVRASMTFPFVFKPITADSIPLYDGGLYDNFPIRPMIRIFHPDFIIGSSVAGKATQKNDRSLYGQLENMVMQKTDYSVSPDEGILIKFSLDNVNLLDFDKSKDLFEIGYKKGLEMVDSIRMRIKRTVSKEEIDQKRADFRNKMPKLIFKNIIIKGGLHDQQSYIESQIRSDKEKTFDMEDFKRAYFKLLTNSKIKEIIPHAVYNESNGYFDLVLDIKIEDELLVTFGGNVSSSNANQLYLGLGYKSLTNYSVNFNLDLQVGNAFNGFMFQGRIEPPYKFPNYLKFIGAFNYRKYYESDKLFIDANLLTFMQQSEGYLKLCIGLPFENKGKSEIRIGYGSLEDKYFQSNTTISNINFDKSDYSLFSIGTSVDINTFDAKQFPTLGENYSILTQFIAGKETYTPGSIISPRQSKASENQSWLQLFAQINNYKTINNRFNYGYLLEAVISSKNLQSNYTTSVMQAPAFTPTPHSKLVFNEAFRSNQYVAGGVTPIYKINKIIHLRGDFNAFMPIYPIKQGPNYKAYYGDLFSKFSYMGEVALIAQLPFLSVSLYGNYYSFPARNWNFGLNIGYVIFNPKFTQ